MASSSARVRIRVAGPTAIQVAAIKPLRRAIVRTGMVGGPAARRRATSRIR